MSKQITKDPYAVLGVARTASEEDIKAAFKRLALEHHPDRGGNGNRMAELNWAYDLLTDAAAKAHYDRFGYDERQGQSITPLEKGILEIWSQLICGQSFEPRIDFIEQIRTEIKTRTETIRREMKSFERQLPKLKKLRALIHKKDGDTRTIFHLHLDKTIDATELCLREKRAEVELHAMQLQYLEDYSFAVERPSENLFTQFSPMPGYEKFLRGQKYGDAH